MRIWSVCAPTAAHLDAFAKVPTVDPAARLLMEKPLCRTRDVLAVTPLPTPTPGRDWS
ncbi:hypothetical protein ACIO13_23145 [Streptomyces sp. NPDC087425]|uniref:hypothetical protein n=1 Tax=unclassified Streptomyces TaxID=2593676 RepID=UPI00382302AA